MPFIGVFLSYLPSRWDAWIRIESLAVYMLLFGIKTFGMATLVFGYPGVGGKAALVVGFSILFFFGDFRKSLINLSSVFIYFMWLSILLFFFYLNGPRTEYSMTKLIATLIYGIVLLISFYYLLNKRNIDWYQLGQLGILSAFVCLAACVIISPYTKPDSLLDLGVMRLASEADKDIFQIRNLLGGIALLGFALLYTSKTDRLIPRLSLIELCIYAFTAFVILAWSGSRLTLFTAVILIPTILLSRPTYKRQFRVLVSLLIGISVLILAYGFLQQPKFLTLLTDTNRPFVSRINREINWMAGYRRFIEKPVYGHGLGGYYIEGYSYPGEGTYAHNLVLELLGETGIVGTALILGPLFFWRRVLRTNLLKKRSQNGNVVFPLLLVLFLQAMISYDLPVNIGFISLRGAMAASTKKAGNLK